MKKILCLLLVFGMVFGLVGCSETVPLNEISSNNSASADNYTLLQENAPDVSAQRDAILNSETEISKGDTFIPGETYTGTAYYVSNSGNDSNSGTSPEQAWATLEKVDTADLQRGDAVFFERGGIWYGHFRARADEVTYSAYGQGNKPIISGGDPHVSNPENWTEHGKTADGGTVWLYNKAQTDVTHILFNAGDTIGLRMTPNYTVDGYVNENGLPFDVLTQFTEDLNFFCELDLTEWDFSNSLYDIYHPAKLYLRCDGGNPAEVFSDIQVMYNLNGIVSEYCGTVIDNLCIQYFGSPGIYCEPAWSSHIREEYELTPSVTVQNCEISYCGGGMDYNAVNDQLWQPSFAGGAIGLGGNGNRALNNYIHDVDKMVFIISYHGFDVQGAGYEGITIDGNLLINNCQAFHLTDYSYWIAGRENPCYFKNFELSNNTILYSGYGWFSELEKSLANDSYYPSLACIELCGNKHPEDSIYITDNLFYGAELCLVFNPSNRDAPEMTGFDDVKEPIFSGNTYVQYKGYAGLLVEEMYPATALETYVREVLGDSTGTVIGQE